nr:PREDICTED: MHC class I polypeptide-related sequence B-like [Equus przewalskii]
MLQWLHLTHVKPLQILSPAYSSPVVNTRACVHLQRSDPAAAPEICARTTPLCLAHSLHYNLTVVSQDGSVQSGFFAEGQLDGQPFLSYDSEKSRAEPQGLWAEAVLGAETWDAEAEDLMEKGKDLKMTLADVMALQDQKGDPWMDSAPVLTSNPGDGDQECWDTDNFQSKDYRARVQGELCQRLWRYLESWMGFRERTVPSSVNVTRSHDWEGIVTLTCWTFGFFPTSH